MEKTIPVRMYYLEMLGPPADSAAQRPSLQVRLASSITLQQYRRVYQQTGEDVGWIDRVLMPDEELRNILEDPGTEVWLFWEGEQVAGFGELVQKDNQEIKLSYFGIVPSFRNKGLGKYFLQKITEIAWQYMPRRVWLQTSELDHPAALPNYLKAGYRIFEEKIENQIIVD